MSGVFIGAFCVFFRAATDGIIRGLVLCALVGIAVSYATIQAQGHADAEWFANDKIISFTSGAVSLLVGFLVANNVSTSLMITSTVADIQGSCMELVSLSHALLRGENGYRSHEAKELEDIATLVLKSIIENIKDSTKESIDSHIFDGFKSVKKAKDRGVIEATLIGVFSRTLSVIATKYDRLYHMRNIGTPPAIRVIVYVLGVVNVVQYVMNMSGEEDAVRISAGTFVSVATIGVLATSAATRDPLDLNGLSGSLKQSVESTIAEIRKMAEPECRSSSSSRLINNSLRGIFLNLDKGGLQPL